MSPILVQGIITSQQVLMALYITNFFYLGRQHSQKFMTLILANDILVPYVDDIRAHPRLLLVADKRHCHPTTARAIRAGGFPAVADGICKNL